MLFTSLEFLLLFLPTVVIINIVLPKKFQNIWLFITSIFFYAWGEPSFVLIMLASIIINYLSALKLEEVRTNRCWAKLILASDISINLGILFVYKYMNFVTSILHSTNESILVTDYVLPIGISFYTFQAISYVVDVYRGEPAQTNIIHVGLYIAFFPQLIAGPIVRYNDIKEQISNRKITFDKFCEGIFIFLIGFNKKILIANILANIADTSFASNTNTILMSWLGAIGYTLQIYFDFSGYSDMAIGLAKLFGFELKKNFDYPYSSKTVTEFWRRWHISLGQWFRDYVYFPLGGSRVSSKGRIIINLMFVWLLTGIWHGANTTFIAWGIAYGIIISIEKTLGIPQKVGNNKKLAIIYQIFTMFTVIVGWVTFRSEGIHIAIDHIMDMFGLRGNSLFDTADLFYLREYGIFLIIGCILSVPCCSRILSKMPNIHNSLAELAIDVVLYGINIALFIVGISYLVISAHNPFIYFNF